MTRVPRRFCILALALLLSACATTQTLPSPRQLKIPPVRRDNGGAFVCPYTQDHVLAEWCDMIIKAGAFRDIGGGAASVASSALGVWSLVLKKVAHSIGRHAAIAAGGGMEHVRATSDTSFDRLDDLAVYIYQFYSAEETYPDALSAAVLLYPELEDRYIPAIKEARK